MTRTLRFQKQEREESTNNLGDMFILREHPVKMSELVIHFNMDESQC